MRRSQGSVEGDHQRSFWTTAREFAKEKQLVSIVEVEYHIASESRLGWMTGLSVHIARIHWQIHHEHTARPSFAETIK
eukprot:scaffold11555_cov111-Cylindrotheca_fusiformis.AAC.1